MLRFISKFSKFTEIIQAVLHTRFIELQNVLNRNFRIYSTLIRWMIPETQIKFRRQTERWTNQSIFKSKQGGGVPALIFGL